MINILLVKLHWAISFFVYLILISFTVYYVADTYVLLPGIYGYMGKGKVVWRGRL